MNIVASLEFFQIIDNIKSACRTTGARELADGISFSTDFDKITHNLRQSYQMRNLLLGLRNFPDVGYIDMRKTLSMLGVKDSCIALEDMPQLYDSLCCIKSILSFLGSEDKEKIPDIYAIMEDVYFDDNILVQCSNIIDEHGNIRPSCSPVLRDIYSKKENKKRQMERQINAILQKSKKEGWSNDDDDISIRNGSMVLPIKATYKRNVKGILHDTSQTGQTFYIEPEEIVSLNFELKELFFEEQREIHRILSEFSDLLRENLENLIACYDMLVEVDFIRAKAVYALKTNSTMPQMSNKPIVDWYDARHPILENALKQKGKQIIPLRIELNEKQRILVISGPNAGGKSVCLKTLALLQYMLQCGLLVPMKEISIAGVFDNIFLSIGDEQSLEDDLSTYSSHLKNLSEICQKADKDSLFLIDELGTGTDPMAGGAIGESILEYLNEINVYGVVTTHYSALKHLAFDHKGIVNAAMLFDTEKMKPLYTLSIGTPGSSFAFEIAQKTGLSKAIIDNAKKKLGNQNIRFEENLQQIEVNKLESEKHLRSAKQYDDILYQTVQKYKDMTLKLEAEKKDILNSARNEAKQILKSANKQIEHTIEQIKTQKAEKQTVKTLKQDIQNTLTAIEHQIQEPVQKEEIKLKKENIKLVTTPIEQGDYVILPQSETIGKVVSIDKNRLQIDMGDIKIQTTKKNVLKIDKTSYLKQQKDNSKTSSKSLVGVQIKTSFDINTIRQHFNPQLDLRGYRGEEAICELEEFLDKARMLGERQIKILHGKGDGILKTLVRDYLHAQKDVESYHPEDIRFGGEGITIVHFR